jgi:hypothetical protein
MTNWKIAAIAIVTIAWLALTIADGASLVATATMLIVNSLTVYTIYLQERRRRRD